MRRRRRQLLEVVADRDRRQPGPRAHDVGERREQQLAADQVEPGGGLVEDDERRVRDQRPREQDAGPLALGAARERPRGELARRRRAAAARSAVCALLRADVLDEEDRAGDPGEHDLAHGLVGVEPPPERGLDEARSAGGARASTPRRAGRRGSSAVPRLGRICADATRRSVDLPAPFGPTTPQRSPCSTRQSTSAEQVAAASVDAAPDADADEVEHGHVTGAGGFRSTPASLGKRPRDTAGRRRETLESLDFAQGVLDAVGAVSVTVI